ncbi:MAG: IS21 family transposase [Nitrospira sp.]|nr:IS21 family transposase [Nitrospira sp.]
MGLDETSETTIMRVQVDQPGEACMVDQERWAEIRRLFDEERVSISEIGRRLDLDRKTVRRSLRQPTWRPYQRAVVAETLLTAHADFVQTRAPQVGYSARILYQELRASRGYTGSYETVKRCVAPLREVQGHADRALLRFETPPGQQSQIDWGQALVSFRAGPQVVHVFVLTLGFSRRGFYYACADERLAQFLESHERAFAHFGGHTREHLYDRPRTVCYADDTGRRIWNPTFKAFADYWGFEPRVCRPYRAQTKGKVESGVKYVKRNFLPGRTFIDLVDFQAQLDEWNATIADCRLHGTTHEPPLHALRENAGSWCHWRGNAASSRRPVSHGSWPRTIWSAWRPTATPCPSASSASGSRCSAGAISCTSSIATGRSRGIRSYPAPTNSASYPSTAPAPVHGPPANADPLGRPRPCLRARCRRSKCGIWRAMRRCAGARRRRRCRDEPGTTGTAP